MPITLEPAVKPASPTRNITHEDFLDKLDRINPAQTPLSSFAVNIVELKSTDRKWTVDSFPSPKGAIGRADGENVTSSSARDWTSNMRPIGNIGQGFDEQFGLGWIAQRIPRIADVSDPLAYARASAYLMLKQHLECAMSSFDQVAVVDQGSGLGSIMGGYRKLTDAANAYSAASAFALGKPSDIHSAPAGACVSGTLATAHNRAMWKSVALALRTALKSKVNLLGILGLTLRQAVTDLTNPGYTSAVATATGTTTPNEQVKVYTRAEDDNVLGQMVDLIITDFGRFPITDSDYIGTTTTDSSGNALSAVNSVSGTGAGARGNSTFISTPKKGLLVEKGNVFKTWGIPWFTEELGKQGGGNVFDAKGFAMLGVYNPIRAGWFNFT